MQNLLVVVASYVFYGWWDWKFLLLIAFTTLCSYASGVLIERYEGSRRIQQYVSAANITVNIAVLCLFKYYNFFADSLAAVFRGMGYEVDWATLNVILPVGISFYTFQALSYTIDVYRHNIRPTRDVVEFFAFISFFPQLVAGPIERATNLLPQFQRNRTFTYEQGIDGFRQMLWGFAKKLIVADNCAIVVNEHWGMYSELSGVELFILVILFSFQIYCDFSGYSDIAIGCAKLFGIRLMRNFDNPYFSRSIPEFWRRWHISLTTWFRDYIYFPLGGSRCSKWKVIRNVYIVWAVSGLWHGANWTFVCWGLYHGTLLAIYNLLGVKTKYEHAAGYGRRLPSGREFLQILLTFVLVVLGFVLFRSESMSQAFGYWTCMFTHAFQSVGHLAGSTINALIYCASLLIIEWVRRARPHVLDLGDVRRPAVAWGICFVIAVLSYCLMANKLSTFIYFQF